VVKKPVIHFKNLTYGYREDNLIFDNFNLSIKAGERIGLVGHSGAGKSTLINLLLKVFNPDFGEILVDDKNIADVTFDSLRENIALIPQDPMLFHRTIFENISYGKFNASKEEVIEAAKKAYIHDFIANLPDTYETLVGERGIKLSGGQRQRIAIARAILYNAPILLLDEATSSLDPISERLIKDALAKLMEGRTSIVIAHRLSTVIHADRIFVISDGKVVESGSHKELIAKNGAYANLYSKQFEVDKE